MSSEKFTILETISEGPSTTVYKAIQNNLGRTVLLKVLHRHLLGDQELVERFRREASACAMLRSEAIVQVYNLDDLDGAPAIVMEYVEGESLKEYLARTSNRSEDFAKTVATAVLQGLIAAHSSGIIHRDIKPGNILVTSDGAVRITDFGLVSILASPGLTVEGVLVGTPAYMSPEQAQGEALDNRTDLFSLGTTLVEIISGKQIFHGTSYGECIGKIMHFKTEMLQPLLGGISREFASFVAKLMEPDRSNRFAAADQALSSLTGASVKIPAGRTRRPLLGVGVALLGVTGLLVAGYFLSGPEPDSPQTVLIGIDSSTVQDDSGRDMASTSRVPVGTLPSRTAQTESKPPARPGADTSNVTISMTDSGYIAITCDPWAKVYLDDQYVGTTPIAGSIRVVAGPHTIAFNNPQFTPIIRTVTVIKNEELAIDADFLKTAGYLLFTSVKPWAEIYIDDQYRDTTPLSQPLIVSSGTRTVRLHNPAFTDHTTQIALRPGDTARISYDFQKQNDQ